MYEKLFNRLKNVDPFVSESLATAKKLYLETNKISQEKFDSLLEKDPSKNKKYIEWMCKVYLDDPEISKFETVAKFDQLVNKKLIKGEDSDITRYESIEKLYDKVKEFEDVKTKGEQQREIKMEGSEKVFENDKAKVYHITTQEASCYYGKGTKWCTAATQSTNYFNRYYGRDNVEFYYVLSKDLPPEDDLFKVAIVVHANGALEAYDVPDRGYTQSGSYSRGDWKRIQDHLDAMGIPMEIFVHKGMNLNRLKHRVTKGEKYDPKTNRRIDVEVKFTKNADGTYDVVGSVNFEQMQLTSLAKSELKFRNVDGDFNCSRNQLTDLKGAPIKVTGEFKCANNKLTSLEGAPKEVGLDFNTEENPTLTSIKGAPDKVGGNFIAKSCGITSLEGFPKSVGKSIILNSNKITSLKGLPQRIQGNLNIYSNPIADAADMPSFVAGGVEISYNPGVTLKKPRFLGGKWSASEYRTSNW